MRHINHSATFFSSRSIGAAIFAENYTQRMCGEVLLLLLLLLRLILKEDYRKYSLVPPRKLYSDRRAGVQESSRSLRVCRRERHRFNKQPGSIVVIMATPPKRPYSLPASPQLNSSFCRKGKKIAIEGNIGELWRLSDWITYQHLISGVIDIFQCFIQNHHAAH